MVSAWIAEAFEVLEHAYGRLDVQAKAMTVE
jgi:hypothetical protein